MRKAITSENVGTATIPPNELEPAHLRNASPQQRRAIYMIAFGRKPKEIKFACGEGLSEHWIQQQSSPKARRQWVQQAVTWIVKNIGKDGFDAFLDIDDYAAIMHELSRLYAQCYKERNWGECRRILEQVADVREKADGGKGKRPAQEVHNTVVFTESTPLMDKLRDRVASMTSTIPGGPRLKAAEPIPLPQDERNSQDE
jgi:hypothetical protein